MRTVYYRAFLVAAALGAAASVSADKFKPPPDVVCPMDGRMLRTDGPGPRYESVGLDLFGNRGLLMMSVPTLPVCHNGFVVYRTSYTTQEIERLKPYVESADYQALRDVHSNYYLSARLRRLLGEPMRDVAMDLVFAMRETDDMIPALRISAVQSVEGQLRNKYGANSRGHEAEFKELYAVEIKRREDDAAMRLDLYATEALTAYKSALAVKYDDNERWLQDQLRAGELERRLGRFDEAKARFQTLSANPGVPQSAVYPSVVAKTVLDRQFELIEKRDRSRGAVPFGIRPKSGG